MLDAILPLFIISTNEFFLPIFVSNMYPLFYYLGWGTKGLSHGGVKEGKLFKVSGYGNYCGVTMILFILVKFYIK